MNRLFFFGLLFLVCCLGCGKSGYTVSGKVLYPDGKPVTNGQVTFNSASFTGGGTIISDGAYTIAVDGGVPAGTYQVAVTAFENTFGASSSNPDGSMKTPKSLIDAKYNNPATSGITCEVKGVTAFNITVEPLK